MMVSLQTRPVVHVTVARSLRLNHYWSEMVVMHTLVAPLTCVRVTVIQICIVPMASNASNETDTHPFLDVLAVVRLTLIIVLCHHCRIKEAMHTQQEFFRYAKVIVIQMHIGGQ